MEKIYIAGSLFTDKQIKQRLEEEKELRKVLKNADIYNPINNGEINDKTLKPTAKNIFDQDTKKVIESDTIIADLDDEDVGVAMEMGIAYGINHVMNFLMEETARNLELEDKDTALALNTALLTIKQKMPKKSIYATCSDIRQDGNDEKGIYKSWGTNQYVIGGVEETGKIFRHFKDLIKYFKKTVK